MARFGSSDNSGQTGDDPTRSTQYSGSGSQYPGPNPAPFGPPDDYQPGNAPTQYADYASMVPPSAPNPAMPENMTFNPPPPTPWFRKTPVLVAWGLLIVAMIAVVIWGIIQLVGRGSGDDGTSGSSSETTTSSSATTTSSSASSTTSSSETSTTASSTESSSAPQSEPPRPQQPPQQAPTPNAPDTEPSHKHHLPPLPSTITIPPVPHVPELPTVITLPPHL